VKSRRTISPTVNSNCGISIALLRASYLCKHIKMIFRVVRINLFYIYWLRFNWSWNNLEFIFINLQKILWSTLLRTMNQIFRLFLILSELDSLDLRILIIRLRSANLRFLPSCDVWWIAFDYRTSIHWDTEHSLRWCCCYALMIQVLLVQVANIFLMCLILFCKCSLIGSTSEILVLTTLKIIWKHHLSWIFKDKVIKAGWTVELHC